MPKQDVLDELTDVNLADLLDAIGVGGVPLLADVVRVAGRPAARAFAQTTLCMDEVAGAHGMRAGACWGLHAFHTALRVRGATTFPLHGPVLVPANHPGMTDALALLAAIPRSDVRIIAARRPFLDLLPNLNKSLIWVDASKSDSLATLRAATAHLRAGGVLVTFPAGSIEPDPALLITTGDAVQHARLRDRLCVSLRNWSRSSDLFARTMPDLQIVPALVSGVIAPAAARSPLRYLRRTPAGRDHFSAMLQISLPSLHNVIATVQFAPPLPIDALALDGKRRASIMRAAVEIMATMMREFADE